MYVSPTRHSYIQIMLAQCAARSCQRWWLMELNLEILLQLSQVLDLNLGGLRSVLCSLGLILNRVGELFKRLRSFVAGLSERKRRHILLFNCRRTAIIFAPLKINLRKFKHCHCTPLRAWRDGQRHTPHKNLYYTNERSTAYILLMFWVAHSQDNNIMKNTHL